jgi:hypothetical protein
MCAKERHFLTTLTKYTDVTEDFDDDECFEIGQTYRLVYRLPSSPGQEEGISLTKNDTHYGWVRIRSRQLVGDVLKKGK